MYSWLSYRVCMVYTRELDWIQVSIQGKKTFFHTLLCVKESCYYWIIKVYLIKEQLNLFVNKMNSNVDISKTFFVSKSRILSPNSRVFLLVESLSWDVSIYLIYFVNEDFFCIMQGIFWTYTEFDYQTLLSFAKIIQSFNLMQNT